MKTITLTNSFHNTSVNIRVPDELENASQFLIWAWVQEKWSTGGRNGKALRYRVHKALCGFHDCTCGVVR